MFITVTENGSKCTYGVTPSVFHPSSCSLSMSVLSTYPQSGAWSRPWVEGVCFLMLESADHSEQRMGQGASRYPSPKMNNQNEFHTW